MENDNEIVTRGILKVELRKELKKELKKEFGIFRKEFDSYKTEVNRQFSYLFKIMMEQFDRIDKRFERLEDDIHGANGIKTFIDKSMRRLEEKFDNSNMDLIKNQISQANKENTDQDKKINEHDLKLENHEVRIRDLEE